MLFRKTIPIILILSYWVYVVLILKVDSGITSILIRYFLSPAYFFILYYYSSFRLQRKAAFLFLHFMHIMLAIIFFFILITYLSPSTNDTPTQENNSYFQNLYEEYQVASANNEHAEAAVYASLIINSFPKKAKILKITNSESKEIQEEAVYLKSLYSTLEKHSKKVEAMTVVNFKNLTKTEILQAVNSLIAVEKYYSAQYMLFRYITIFGLGPEVERVSAQLTVFLNKPLLKASDRRMLDFENELRQWHEVLENPLSTEMDFIAGYRTLLALENTTMKNDTLAWLQNAYIRKLSEFTFFAGDLRQGMITKRTKKPIQFLLKEKDSTLIVSAQGLVPTQAYGYFKDMELIQISSNGKIAFHLSTPYAKLSNNTLYINAIERNTGFVRYKPELRRGEYNNKNWYMTVPMHHTELIDLEIDASQGNFWNLINMLPLWKKYFLPVNTLYINILFIVLPALLFLLGGYVVLNYSASNVSMKKENVYQQSPNILVVTTIILSIVPIEFLLQSWVIYSAKAYTYSVFRRQIYVLAALYVFFLCFNVIMLHAKEKRLRSLS